MARSGSSRTWTSVWWVKHTHTHTDPRGRSLLHRLIPPLQSTKASFILVLALSFLLCPSDLQVLTPHFLPSATSPGLQRLL